MKAIFFPLPILKLFGGNAKLSREPWCCLADGSRRRSAQKRWRLFPQLVSPEVKLIPEIGNMKYCYLHFSLRLCNCRWVS